MKCSYNEQKFCVVQMRSNEPNLMLKHQFFKNSYYIYLCGATLMACESWKVVFIE
jgi:hypothetical protein